MAGAGRRASGDAPGVRDPRRRVVGGPRSTLRADGHAGVRGRRLAARRAPRARARRLGPRHGRPARPDPSSCSPAPSTRTGSGRWRSARRRGVRDHDLPDRPRLRRLTGGRTGWSSATTSGRPRPARLHGQRAWRGAARPSADGDGRRPRSSSTRSTALRDLERGPCAPSAIPARVSTRTRCGWSGRSGSRRRSSSRSSRRRSRRSRANAGLVAHLSGERIAAELERLLEAPRAVDRAPARGRHRAARGHRPGARGPAGHPAEQDRRRGPLGPHAADRRRGAGRSRPIVRLAALLHDIGKPATLADGHFHHHDVVGAELAEALLRRLRFPRPTRGRRPSRRAPHVHRTSPTWSDAAVRRFIRRIGPHALDDLFALRQADNIGSGLPPDAGAARVPCARRRRARGRGRARPRRARDRRRRPDPRARPARPGRALGRMLDALLERVIADPALNDGATLLLLAQGMLADMPGRGRR